MKSWMPTGFRTGGAIFNCTSAQLPCFLKTKSTGWSEVVTAPGDSPIGASRFSSYRHPEGGNEQPRITVNAMWKGPEKIPIFELAMKFFRCGRGKKWLAFIQIIIFFWDPLTDRRSFLSASQWARSCIAGMVGGPRAWLYLFDYYFLKTVKCLAMACVIGCTKSLIFVHSHFQN